MPVEIIPRKAARVAFWQKILFYILVLLLLVVLLSYFILGHFQRKSLTALQELEEALIRERTPEKIALEKEILNTRYKINDFSLLLDNHFLASKFFEFLGKTAHPRVRYSQITLNPREGLALISGQAESFTALGQQSQILKRESALKDISLSEISLGDEGEIEFTLAISFDPKFLK